MPTQYERFRELLATAIDDPSACLMWPTKDGRYASVRFNGKTHGMHRLAYEIHTGKPIPDAVNICHRCDHPPCFNPYHLWPGSSSANHIDGIVKGRVTQGFKAGEANVGASLTAEQCAEIRAAYVPRKNGQKLATKYGVCVSTICKIASGKRWSSA